MGQEFAFVSHDRSEFLHDLLSYKGMAREAKIRMIEAEEKKRAKEAAKKAKEEAEAAAGDGEAKAEAESDSETAGEES